MRGGLRGEKEKKNLNLVSGGRETDALMRREEAK